MVEAMSPKERQTYTVRCVRENDWWIVTVEELDGVFTQARRIDQVWGLARDAIALWLDAAPDSFDLELEIDIYGDAGEARQDALDARAAADEARARAALTTTTAVEKLIDAGLPMRDVGALLDISHQRVAQIMGEKPTVARARKAPAARRTSAKAASAAGRVIKNSTSTKASKSGATAKVGGGRSGRFVAKNAGTKGATRRD
jgi:hypothetical protein